MTLQVSLVILFLEVRARLNPIRSTNEHTSYPVWTSLQNKSPLWMLVFPTDMSVPEGYWKWVIATLFWWRNGVRHVLMTHSRPHVAPLCYLVWVLHLLLEYRLPSTQHGGWSCDSCPLQKPRRHCVLPWKQQVTVITQWRHSTFAQDDVAFAGIIVAYSAKDLVV